MRKKICIVDDRAIGGTLTNWGITLDSAGNEISRVQITPADFPQWQPTPPDWAGFRQWRRGNSAYRNLLRTEPGLVMALESDIDKGDFNSASLVWNELKTLGSISEQLELEIIQALNYYNLQTLLEALTNYNLT
jgi:hypothetical protein